MMIRVQVIGWENIELISDRPLETMLDEFKRLKQEYPDRQAAPLTETVLHIPMSSDRSSSG